MPDATAEDRLARIHLAAIAEPFDAITCTLIAQLGAVETLRLVTTKVRVPLHDQVEAALWRRQLAARMDPRLVDRVQRDTERHGLRVLMPEDPDWPSELSDLHEAAPYALWVGGSVEPLSVAGSRRITIVGARAATAYGEHVATDLAAALAERGSTIISGGAYGIDGAAHRASIAARPGATAVVLATGLDRSYPSGHQSLFERVRESGGTLVSELPPGTTPTKWGFIARNRLLAVLGGATIVVEAGWRSGSLDIVRHASALGRPVGAVPGPITSAASSGCHRLLREGVASVVTDVDDIRGLAEAGADLINQRVLRLERQTPAVRHIVRDLGR